MEWQEISGSWILIPRDPKAMIHFLGGAFVGTAPSITYRWLLEQLAKEGYGIVATPFLNTFDHTAIARIVLNRYETIIERLYTQNKISQRYLPTYGLGHSMGCKLHLLIGSLLSVQRAGNILVSYNNYPVRRAIPFLEQIDTENTLNLEFTPSPEETNELIAQNYQVRRNLLIKFNNDDIDQTALLKPVLIERFNNMTAFRLIDGNHLTPLGQDIQWQNSGNFTPLDAIGQWIKQTLSRDLMNLKTEILYWLNPTTIR
ncbi:MAG: DUF1350 family protein [Microcystaceae cyanobacterium]